jgi:hypothetical protein
MSKPVTTQDMFDMWQKMVNPSGYPLQSLMFPILDTKEIEKKIGELETVEHWLKANVNMIQLTVKSLQYQLAMLKGGEKAQEVLTGKDRVTGKDRETGKEREAGKERETGKQQGEEEANPAMWAWNMMANAGKNAVEAAQAPPPPAPKAKKKKKAAE